MDCLVSAIVKVGEVLHLDMSGFEDWYVDQSLSGKLQEGELRNPEDDMPYV